MPLPAGGLANSSLTIYGVNANDEAVEENYVRFGRSKATRQILVSWLDRVPLINTLGSYAGLNVGGVYQYIPSVPFPDAPLLLYFSGIKTEGIATGGQGLTTGPNGMVGYQLARCWIEYSSQPYIELDQGTLSIKYAPQDANLPQTVSAYYFDSTSGTPLTPAQFPSIQINMVSFVWTQFNLISIPVSTINAAVASPIDTSGLFGTAAGTLMFVAPEFNRRMSTIGIEMWDATYVCLMNPAGWNKVFYPSSQGGDDTFHNIVDKSGNPPFKLDNAGNIPALIKNTGY